MSVTPYVGQTDITTVGTITLGTWNGNVVNVPYGGTGLSSGTSGGIPYFSASNTMASSAALGAAQVVVGGGAGAAPLTYSSFTYTYATQTLSWGVSGTTSLMQPPAQSGAGIALSVRAGDSSVSGSAGSLSLFGGLPTEGNGGGVTITARPGATLTSTTRAGGSINLTAGAGVVAGAGGSVTITSGAGGPTGQSGGFTFTSGPGGATSGNSGPLNLRTGNCAGSGNTGAIVAIVGTANTGNGGAVSFRSGISTAGNGGNVAFAAGYGATRAQDGYFYVLSARGEEWRVDTDGNFSGQTVGIGFRLKEGTNAKMGLATLAGGTVTVANTAVTANTRIFLTVQTLSGAAVPQAVAPANVIAGTSFDIISASAADTSTVAWLLIEPT